VERLGFGRRTYFHVSRTILKLLKIVLDIDTLHDMIGKIPMDITSGYTAFIVQVSKFCLTLKL
jgi:hypothetical protein